MKTRMPALILIFLSVIILVTACSSGATTSTPAASKSSAGLDGAALFQERCSTCHRLPTNLRGTADQWKTMVEYMVARGAQLNSAEQTAVIDYLAANYGN